MKLKDKTCIVTGAAGSLGQSAARLFLQEGARVLLVDSNEAALKAAAHSMDSDRVDYMAADVTQARDTKAYIDRAVEKWGGLDVLFGNAGVNGQISSIADYPEDDFDRVMAVNVKGCFLACKYGMPVMQAGEAVVLTSSVVGVTADPGICAYATSKHALIGLMRVAAKEGAQRGIRVNVIAPGPHRQQLPAGHRKKAFPGGGPGRHQDA